MAICEHDPQHARGKCPSMAVAKEFASTGGKKLSSLPKRKGPPTTKRY